MFDPLYNWSLTPAKAYKIQYGREPGPALRKQWDKSAEESKGQKANKLAERALLRVTHKLNGMEEGSHLSVQGQVNQRNLIIVRKVYLIYSHFQKFDIVSNSYLQFRFVGESKKP